MTTERATSKQIHEQQRRYPRSWSTKNRRSMPYQQFPKNNQNLEAGTSNYKENLSTTWCTAKADSKSLGKFPTSETCDHSLSKDSPMPKISKAGIHKRQMKYPFDLESSEKQKENAGIHSSCFVSKWNNFLIPNSEPEDTD